MSPIPQPRVIAVGAYERDNFGDLLYREIMRDLFAGRADATFAAPFAAEADEWVESVEAAAPLLNETDVDAIWTVGGEVGATDMAYVYMTRFGHEPGSSLDGLSPADRDTAMRGRADGSLFDSPYIPRPSAHHGAQSARLILNSIGVAGIPHQSAWRRTQLTSVLREASFVSVRDAKSSGFLSAAGIEHTLAPDLVHALALTRPRPHVSGHAVVHLSDFQLRAHPIPVWAEALAASDALFRMPVRLFLAGTAPGHDSLDSAQALVEMLVRKRPGSDVEVSISRGVWPRVDEIAAASLWAGSSLHGRIIAQAYGVPRVSFDKGKLNTYASTWDTDMPAGIDPSSLVAAIDAALETDSTPAVALGERALESIEQAFATLGAARDDAARSRALLDVRVDESHELAALAEALRGQLDAAGVTEKDLRRQLQRSEDRARALQEQLDAVHASASWRAARAAARVVAPIRGIVRRGR